MSITLFATMTFFSSIVLFYLAFFHTADHFYEGRKLGMIICSSICVVYFSIFVLSFAHILNTPVLNVYSLFGALVPAIATIAVLGKAMSKFNETIVLALEKSV